MLTFPYADVRVYGFVPCRACVWRRIGPTEGKLRYDPVAPLWLFLYFRFTFLHWHFCDRIASHSPLSFDHHGQNCRFPDFWEISSSPMGRQACKATIHALKLRMLTRNSWSTSS